MSKKLNLENQKFNKLLVLSLSHTDNKHQTVWNCVCDCGNLIKVRGTALKTNNTTSCGCNAKFAKGESNFNRLYYQYNLKAKKRKYSFELTKEEFKKLVTDVCFYCARKPKQVIKAKKHHGDFIYNGVDRVNNKQGYTIDNVVSCCKICNRAKQTLTVEEFKNWIKEIYGHLFLK